MPMWLFIWIGIEVVLAWVIGLCILAALALFFGSLIFPEARGMSDALFNIGLAAMALLFAMLGIDFVVERSWRWLKPS